MEEPRTNSSMHPWERTKSLCGYSLFAPLFRTGCHHQDCWSDRAALRAAAKLLEDDEHGDCDACEPCITVSGYRSKTTGVEYG